MAWGVGRKPRVVYVRQKCDRRGPGRDSQTPHEHSRTQLNAHVHHKAQKGGRVPSLPSPPATPHLPIHAHALPAPRAARPRPTKQCDAEFGYPKSDFHTPTTARGARTLQTHIPAARKSQTRTPDTAVRQEISPRNKSNPGKRPQTSRTEESPPPNTKGKEKHAPKHEKNHTKHETNHTKHEKNHTKHQNNHTRHEENHTRHPQLRSLTPAVWRNLECDTHVIKM